MKRINTVTYCTWMSIGSVLQAYGLFETLKDQGYKNTIIVETWNKVFANKKTKSFKGLVRRIFELNIQSKQKLAYKKRMQFINEKMEIEYLEGFKEFQDKAITDRESIYLAGSDQIWQPDNCNPIFFLDFVKDSKCISYAASMGKTIVAEGKKEIFQKMINKFDYISVREEECADVIRKITEKSVEVNIDPTFLVSTERWREISDPYNIDDSYILLYMLYWDKSYNDKIKKLKKKTGLKVYAISDRLSNVYADRVLYDVGIGEFLWLVDHAEYVITSSFHGTAFATIFNKKFSTIINPKAPSRIENLTRKLSLPIVDIEDLPTTEKFNYDIINEMIEREKNKSIDYLKKVLE